MRPPLASELLEYLLPIYQSYYSSRRTSSPPDWILSQGVKSLTDFTIHMHPLCRQRPTQTPTLFKTRHVLRDLILQRGTDQFLRGENFDAEEAYKALSEPFRDRA